MDAVEAATRVGDCDYCGSTSVSVCPTEELRDLFRPLLDIYTPWAYGEHYIDPDHNWYGEQLGQLVQDDWQTFRDGVDVQAINALLNDILQPDGDASDGWGSVDEELTAGPGEEEVWRDFCEHITHKRRYFASEYLEREYGRDHIALILDGAESSISAGDTVYRARVGGRYDEMGGVIAFPIEEMHAPPGDSRRGGRANPPGISYLYVALEEETAVAEMRVGISAPVSVAELRASKDLSIVDLSAIEPLSSPLGVEALEFEIRARALLREFASELSRPVHASDPELSYIPSQYLAEMILELGYDGIIYRSSYRSSGRNAVIFDPEALDVVDTKLVTIKAIEHRY